MNSHGVKFGLLAGIGTVLILLTSYYIDKRLMLSPSVVWSTMIFYLIGMYMAAMEDRKSNGGFISFQEALKTCVIVWMVANAIYHLFIYFHFNYFDPDMLNVQKEMFLEMNEQAGLLDEKLSTKMVEELSYDFMQTITGYMMSLVGGFAISAIIARLIRRDNFSEKTTP